MIVIAIQECFISLCSPRSAPFTVSSQTPAGSLFLLNYNNTLYMCVERDTFQSVLFTVYYLVFPGACWSWPPWTGLTSLDWTEVRKLPHRLAVSIERLHHIFLFTYLSFLKQAVEVLFESLLLMLDSFIMVDNHSCRPQPRVHIKLFNCFL